MKLKYIAYSALPLLGIGIIGVNVAGAHGFREFGGGFSGMTGMMGNNLTPDQIASNQQAFFQDQANLLGISIDEVKNAWAQGKNLRQIAQEKGMTNDEFQQKIKDARIAAVKSRLQVMADKGIITEAQKNQRSQFLENNQSVKVKARGMHQMTGGFF